MCVLLLLHLSLYVCGWMLGHCSPPPVDANVRRSCKPGVEDVHAADSIRSQQRFLERRVVVEPQALPEPVDRINDHYSTGRVLFVSLNDIKSFCVLAPLLFRLTDCFKIYIFIYISKGERKKTGRTRPLESPNV